MLASRVTDGAAARASALCPAGGPGRLSAIARPQACAMHLPLPVVIVASLVLLAGCTGASDRPEPAASPPAPFNVLGPADAPLTIIEFTDLQCPYCARFARETFPRLRREYVDTGRLRYVSRDLPLPMHAQALPAAVASRCAGEQGRYWEYREALFAAQATLRSEPYARIAGELGLDVARLEACRRDPRQAAAVRADLELAQGNGIRSTPTFVIGREVNGRFEGEQVSGAVPFDVLAAKVDELLAAPR